jgi:hypothetical protein
MDAALTSVLRSLVLGRSVAALATLHDGAPAAGGGGGRGGPPPTTAPPAPRWCRSPRRSTAAGCDSSPT